MIFENYAATDSAGLEELIRANVQTLQAVQARLWAAHSSWRNGRLLSGVLFPPERILQIAKYDWSEAVNAWQESVDTWWSERLTGALREAPDEVGEDGKTRLEAWIAMGQHLIPWAEDIAKRMGDDTLANDVRELGRSFRTAVKLWVEGGAELAKAAVFALPWWAKVGIGLVVAAKIYGLTRK